VILGTTRKLMDNLKTGFQNVVVLNDKSFWDWHAHIFIYNRRKCVIAINNLTRYCIILYGLRAEHFKNFDSILLSAMRGTFIAEGFDNQKVDRYIEACGQVICTKTYNRSIIGSLNDFLYLAEYKMAECDLTKMNLVDLNRCMGKFVSSKLDLIFPIEMLKREFEKL